MSKIKSFSVGNGDMFYINHGSDNLSIIDCNLSDDESIKNGIINEIKSYKDRKGIVRFISTHPDQDHISGLKTLDQEIDILNFYCVKNSANKNSETEDFTHYTKLRDDQGKVFYLYKDCSRKWMNNGCDERGSSGINILWPDTNNEDFQNELDVVKNEGSPNNISPIIKYSLENGGTALWMGDLEIDFMDKIINEVQFSKVNVLFAPHHGRDSGKVPEKWLKQMNPDVIVIGEAPSGNLNYYQGYNTITQNTAGHITFYFKTGVINIFSANENYSVSFLDNHYLESDEYGEHYLGSIDV